MNEWTLIFGKCSLHHHAVRKTAVLPSESQEIFQGERVFILLRTKWKRNKTTYWFLWIPSNCSTGSIRLASAVSVGVEAFVLSSWAEINTELIGFLGIMGNFFYAACTAVLEFIRKHFITNAKGCEKCICDLMEFQSSRTEEKKPPCILGKITHQQKERARSFHLPPSCTSYKSSTLQRGWSYRHIYFWNQVYFRA